MEEEYKFEGSVPDYYDRLFGTQLFEPYAIDLISHLPDTVSIGRVLELGCGTGRCTRQIITQLKGSIELIATDISEEMLKFAEKVVSSAQEDSGANISWEIVDECELPYEDNYFDLVVCQFGFMFGSDKQKAFAESVRVLKPGGVLLFNVWDDIDKNPLCCIADKVIKQSHPDDHDDFFRLPYSMHDREVVSSLLQGVGLVDLSIMDESIKCWWNTASEAADAIIDGSPISLILKGRGEDLKPTLDKITAAYLDHREATEREEATAAGEEVPAGDGDGDGAEQMAFIMNAVIFMGFKPSLSV